MYTYVGKEELDDFPFRLEPGSHCHEFVREILPSVAVSDPWPPAPRSLIVSLACIIFGLTHLCFVKLVRSPVEPRHL